ncbi:hypothetical protein HYFRA_00001468 [Hymenoscyphus fraxineus]|uniref:Uncharacterized protein n=1 Tax=Hymenoscyphus fraxineus TaxID=746836 RepID=A0A9N9L8Q0_9HELO|nr:hypothetical protein HYFRA_00001468 [Hymenoscyphus fraxineus]
MRLTLTQLLVAAALTVGVNAQYPCTRNAECPPCTGENAGKTPVCKVTYVMAASSTSCICE